MFAKHLHCCITVSEGKVMFCSSLGQSANDAKVVALTLVGTIHLSVELNDPLVPLPNENVLDVNIVALSLFTCSQIHLFYCMRLVRIMRNMIIR